jgi:hypothetical protein
VQKSLERQAGAAKALVSLRDGTAEITPKEDGEIDPRQLLKATYDSGVSVAEMDVTLSGQVTRVPDSLAIEYAPGRSFTLSPNNLSAQLDSLAGSKTARRKRRKFPNN